MKQKKFKKVVEWEKRPNNLGFILSIINFFISIVIFINFSYFTLFEKVVGAIVICLLIIFGVLIFKGSLGRGRKVYWEEIPQRASAAAIRRKTLK